MDFLDLPLELSSHIFRLALVSHHRRTDLLTLNSAIYAEVLPLIYRSPRLCSLRSLQSFLVAPTRGQTVYVESIEIRLPGGLASKKLWGLLREVFERCAREDGNRCGPKYINFVLDSLASDPNLHLLSETLASVNPNTFAWSGPDPDHNFSCAIVPRATDQLFQGIQSWSSLSTLSLSSISFSRCRGRSLLSLTPFSHPLLTSIILSQVVFLHPAAVAALALQLPGVEKIHCIDAYQESIYGPRVRGRDVEASVKGRIDLDDSASVRALQDRLRELGVLEGLGRVREVVKCEARLERIMGGDREMA